MAHKSDQEIIRTNKNTARFFVENRHISWILLVATVLWGVFAYVSMPKRKDPEVQVRVAAALIPWKGASAEDVEQLVSEKAEAKIAENVNIKKIESISRTGLSVLFIELDENTKDTRKEFDDIKLRLDSIHDFPSGAGPVNFIKDFGDTAALMLTVASPKVSGAELEIRIRDTREAIERVRASRKTNGPGKPFSIVQHFPRSMDPEPIRRAANNFVGEASLGDVYHDVRIFEGSGFVGVDGTTSLETSDIQALMEHTKNQRMLSSEFHPDAWEIIVIRDSAETAAAMNSVAGDKYTYRQLEDFTETIQKNFQAIPIVSKVDRNGILSERILLSFSQERLASYGLQGSQIGQIISARNINQSGGEIIAGGRNVSIDPSGEFKGERELEEVAVTTSANGVPVYLRDIATVVREYDTPARYLNFYTSKDKNGNWHRNRAITLSIQMRSGEQIGEFGKAVDATLANLAHKLPADLIVSRTSDQPLQVRENISLFMGSLMEAVVLVVLISWIGFWEWRSALLMALSIPLTLAMTFGMMHLLGIDLQQISIASLIIALGLLVDDPVVAGDAIKRDLGLGHKPVVAAWLGPIKLATAIMFATVTNIVAYLPFLLLEGDSGKFLFSLAVVMTCALVASRLVSMTFIPLLGYYLLKPKIEEPIHERRNKGFAAVYYRIGGWAIDHRWKVFGGSLAVLVLGGVFASQLKPQFFPKDLSYLSYIDVWLPNDAPLGETDKAAARVEQIVRQVTDEYGREHPSKENKSEGVLKSLTTFVGGGGPRFWFSVSPELQQLNYAQVIIQVNDKHDTNRLVDRLQTALSAGVPGARVDVRQLESGSSVGIPVSIRLSGEDMHLLQTHAGQLMQILQEQPMARRVREDWGNNGVNIMVDTFSDRANLAGITNQDVANSASAATTGTKLTTLRDGDKQIPVVAKLRMEERATLSDLESFYVGSSQSTQKVPLTEIASLRTEMRPEKIRRRAQFRTITVSAFPSEGHLPSELLMAAMPRIREFEKTLPIGYHLEIGGEYEEQQKGFKSIAKVMAISISAIFLALVFQFRNAVKPIIVFAAIPYGMVGAFAALWIMRMPFGFMAFLGIASLIGVIVSHVIVLFDFIEEAHERGESLRESLLDAGIVRLRPVMITVGATVIALFPLAAHGGPLWEPLCYAQIGGLTIATFITLLLVPVMYAIFVHDLKWVKWGSENSESESAALEAAHLLPLNAELPAGD